MGKEVFVSSHERVTVRYACNGSEVKCVITLVPVIPRIGEHVMLDIGHGGINRKLVVTDVVYEMYNDIVVLVDYETGTKESQKNNMSPKLENHPRDKSKKGPKQKFWSGKYDS